MEQMMSRTTLVLVLVAGSLLSGGQALAQPLRPSETAGDPWRALEPVEQGFGDVDPLAASLRDLQRDLRDPFGFERVYRVPGRDDLLMRAHGGLYAVFPRSWYERSRKGTMVKVPPQTTFFIGRPTAATLGPSQVEPSDGDEALIASPSGLASRLNEQMITEPSRGTGRLESRTDPALFSDENERRGADEQPPPSASTEPSDASEPRRPRYNLPATSSMPKIEPRIVCDEAYRSRRLRELMRRAAMREPQHNDPAATGPNRDREAD